MKQTISSTIGIRGTADTCLVITKDKRGNEELKLSILGRDVERQELKLKQDSMRTK